MKSTNVDEIRLDGGRVDLISSAAFAADFIRALLGFHRGIAAISFRNY
ncbi:MAG: hypothetical protein J6330_05200 [Clostridia bacterium]|nr:hypothetical protein [Clostridia bacterium]